MPSVDIDGEINIFNILTKYFEHTDNTGKTCPKVWSLPHHNYKTDVFLMPNTQTFLDYLVQSF